MGKSLAVNAGSSTLKFKLFEMPAEKVIASGTFERIGLGSSNITIKYGDGKKFKDVQDLENHEQAVHMMLDKLIDLDIIKNYDEITGVGHRVVAGGEFFKDSAIVNDKVIKQIESLTEFAPLHEPAALIGIKAFRKILPNVISVVVFDTSFHTTIPEVNYMYSLPYEYYQNAKVRKYGAHGTSFRYVSARTAEFLGKPLKDLKLVICHLGAGASIDAVKNGKSFDTSMGFSPLAGITMATRSGDVDVSAIQYAMHKEGVENIDDMIDILNHKSGLVGISGVSADMREIEQVMDTNHRAMLAREIFKNRIVKYIGSYVAEMGGIDALVYTAGIGENDISIRQEIADQLGYFGIGVDPEKNNVRGVERDLSAKGSKVKTLLIPTNEELMIVRDIERLRKTQNN